MARIDPTDIYEFVPLGEYIVRAAGICGGRPTFKNTRIEVAGALDRLAAGETLDSIVEGYGGGVPRKAVQEAVQIATQGFLSSLPELAA